MVIHTPTDRMCFSYMKSTVGVAVSNGGLLGARLAPGTVTTSSSSSAATSTTAPTTSPGSFTNSSSVLPTTSIVGSSSTFTPTTSATPSSSQAPLSCPASNETVYNSPAGNAYMIECGIDHAGGDIGSTQSFSLEACIAACDASSGCVDLSLLGVGTKPAFPIFRKYHVLTDLLSV